jgi:hypothetical protein
MSDSAKREQLLKLKDSGASDAKIQAQLGLVRVSPPEDEIITPMSSNTDATVATPTIYYDTGIKKYYVSASYAWKNLQTKGDSAGSGYDGFAVRFSADIVNYGVSASFCPGNWGGATPYPGTNAACIVPQPEDNNTDGASFKFRDRLSEAYCGGTDYPSCWQYVGAKGNLVFTFTRVAGTSGCLQVFSKYGHTWSGTSISSVGLSNGGISFNFSSTSNRWDISSSSSGKLGC